VGGLDRRIKRLAARVQGSAGSLQQARLQRVSDEDLMAEVVRTALTLGMPEELAHGDHEAALAWGAECLRLARAARRSSGASIGGPDRREQHLHENVRRTRGPARPYTGPEHAGPVSRK
jgi:hypothetical protein